MNDLLHEFEVSIYGFWTELQRTAIPTDKNIYFIFSGIILGDAVCRIARTLYIGEGDAASNVIRAGDFSRFKSELSVGESLFFATGEVTGDVAVVQEALVRQFNPTIRDEAAGMRRAQTIPVRIHIVGKVPGIYRGSEVFEVTL